MSSLANILGGPWSPPSERLPDPPETQLHDAMLAAGITPPDDILMDGKIHRFRSGTKGKGGSGDKSGWYVAYSDGVPAGRFGCWRAGVEVTFRADVGRTLTPAEEMAHARRMAEAKAVREAELQKQREVVSDTVEAIWAAAPAALPEHPYLMRKGIQPNGARTTGDGRLVVPLFSSDGDLSSLQYIAHDGEKRYHPGGATGGKFWIIGTTDDPGPLYLAEGYATAATIHEATGRPCVVAYSASNLVPVAGALRERYGSAQDIVIVADNDASQVGQRYAEQASAKYGARFVVPPEQGDANDYAQAGNDLRQLLEPEQDDWLVPADEFSAQPAPIAWLVKGWLQQNALIMIHGPSGGGKTFMFLHWCMAMASGMDEWEGQKIKPGPVVYLAGEGHHGLRGRVAAWKHHHKAKSLKMWLSKDGCDLNTPEGYSRVVEHIRSLPVRPALIGVDTLHRFLNGDENSAQDAKTMLDACGALMREFGCSVVLVHHTGVSDEAQHRARGSSAWRGALDIEISVVPAKGDDPMQVVQRKSKDAEISEPFCADIKSVEIPGWFDEDGEPVKSAVVEMADAPARPTEKDSKHAKHIKMLEQAWRHSGCETRENRPYITRSGFIDYLTSSLGLKEASAKVYAKPSAAGRPISDLLVGGTICNFEHGWSVADLEVSSAWMMTNTV